MIEFIIAEKEKDIETIRILFKEYAEYIKTDLCFQNFKRELDSLPGDYGEPEGRLFLIRCDGKIAGCIALRKFAEGVCEMKRLYVREEFRGMRLGRKAAERIISDSREIGYEKMRLDTLPTMKEAIALYKSLGFTETLPYRNNPVKGAVFMELSLTS